MIFTFFRNLVFLCPQYGNDVTSEETASLDEDNDESFQTVVCRSGAKVAAAKK